MTGKRIISTRVHGGVTIREENATAALEVMSRFAANPKWLIHLPPTMSPCETTTQPGLLEHPAEAFAYFRSQGVPRLVCEEKHMGSRAIVVVCRDAEAAGKRFGVMSGESGICCTRTGRRFFDKTELETGLLERVQAAVTRAGLWDELETDWLCLDCELMPWPAKAHDWHMQTLARLAGGILIATPWRIIDITQPESEAEGIGWWEALTSTGGEGMVVKPLQFTTRSRCGLVQPAVKCRGRDYLRINYGPEYTAPENLERLRKRGLATKRALALREFALGIESLERFVRKEPLRRIHEAVFGVLALETEPMDPRL